MVEPLFSVVPSRSVPLMCDCWPHSISTCFSACNQFNADIAGPTLHAFTIDGTLLHTVGTPGKGGNGVAPPQFSAPADIARTGNDGTDGFILVSDGDGGSNNRVLNLVYGSNQTWDVVYGVGGLGTGPGQFNSPHSIAYQASMKRFWVADRGNTRLQIFDSTNGEYLGEWGSDCFNGGTPWGVRVDDARNRVVVADGTTGQLYILDATKANTKPFPSACDPASTVLQSFTIGVAEKPHLVEVDYWTGDVYLASVGTPTLIQKYTRTG